MRLSTRLSIFFLAALALVLIGFSTALFAMASRYLHRQIDERLEATLNTLAAAAEISPAGVEWEPGERMLSFGHRTLEVPLCWLVCDEQGHRLDGSPNRELDRVLLTASGIDFDRRLGSITDSRGVSWRVLHRRLEPSIATEAQVNDQEKPAVLHAALVLAAAVSMEGIEGALRTLALVLAGLSLALWMMALACGRHLSRRALLPITRMAAAAQSIGGNDLDQRLPVPKSTDELEELGRSFNALLDRLQVSFERQQRFTGDASHQLRTPLTALQGQVDLALRHDRDVEEYRRVLKVVQGKTRQLRQIVESLLFLARADHETLAPLLERIDLAAWVRAHVLLWQDSRRTTLPREVDLERKATESPLAVRVQPALLAELVTNLLDNAAQYGRPGEPIRVCLQQTGAWAELSVEDHGMGIAEEEIPHLFEPFYRSPEARWQGFAGTGLGLSVAARLAAAFKGTIIVTSRRGHGSQFTLRLPSESFVATEAAREDRIGEVDGAELPSRQAVGDVAPSRGSDAHELRLGPGP
jgi:signal transduction histidine kinase